MPRPLPEFQALGKKSVDSPATLETFPSPGSVERVKMTSDEVTAMCPVTGQPDLYTVDIDYRPGERCIESKSLKLYLQSFRNEGVFCEDLADTILRDVAHAVSPVDCTVTVVQKARGGISIQATARLSPLDTATRDDD